MNRITKGSFFLILFFILFAEANDLYSQTNKNKNLVQFSGMVLDGSDERLIPIPFTNVIVKGKQRGTFTDFKGFFSIVVEKGDIIIFSSVGYKTIEFAIPDSLNDNRYSVVQLMTQDPVNLPETIVFPWPSRDHFKLEFLAMDVTDEMQEQAVRNLANESLEAMRNNVRVDGNEAADYYLRRQASNYYYIGQTPPMNIFNPVAWKQFFDSWKNGDFKKKE
jgi:hypothetical protein